MSMFPRCYPRCDKCNKEFRRVWGSAEWHSANDPIEGYCFCDSPFNAMLHAAIDALTKQSVSLPQSSSKTNDQAIASMSSGEQR